MVPNFARLPMVPILQDSANGAKFCKTAKWCLSHPPESSSTESGYRSRPPLLLPLTGAYFIVTAFYCHSIAQWYHFHFSSTTLTSHRGISYSQSIAQLYHLHFSSTTPITSHRGILLSQHSNAISLSLFIINTSYLSERHIIVTTAKQYHFHFPSTHQHNTFHRGIFYCHSISQRYHFLSTPLTSHRGII